MKRLCGLAFVLAVCISPLALWAQGRGGGRSMGHAGCPAAPGAAPQMDRGRSASRGPAMEQHGPSMAGKQPMSVPDRLADHPRLQSRLEPLFPAGTDVRQAAAGFRNLGQFVAAAHVSRNLEIPFDQLKGQMLGPAKGSLGKSVETLRPDLQEAKVKAEVKRAE